MAMDTQLGQQVTSLLLSASLLTANLGLQSSLPSPPQLQSQS